MLTAEFTTVLFLTSGWTLIIINLFFLLKDREEKNNIFVKKGPRTSQECLGQIEIARFPLWRLWLLTLSLPGQGFFLHLCKRRIDLGHL